MKDANAIVANNYDSRAHHGYFAASLKMTFAQLIFMEERQSPKKRDTTVLTASSPSNQLLGINITLFKDDIKIEIAGIHFIKRFSPATVPVITAPDADPRIPTRLQALDFIRQIIEDRILFRCYRHNGKIIRTELVNLLSDTISEIKNYSLRGSFIKFSSKYEVSEDLWSGRKIQKV